MYTPTIPFGTPYLVFSRLAIALPFQTWRP